VEIPLALAPLYSPTSRSSSSRRVAMRNADAPNRPETHYVTDRLVLLATLAISILILARLGLQQRSTADLLLVPKVPRNRPPVARTRRLHFQPRPRRRDRPALQYRPTVVPSIPTARRTLSAGSTFTSVASTTTNRFPADRHQFAEKLKKVSRRDGRITEWFP